ncbi:hypothetical protein HU985_15145 [Photobacterium damselae subsp. damselae]|uniref:hypothetical protein n=1 Tax=Photobacterium damselae TaxID=38293 RepID=UPI001593E903|nr:hypothetical protein [Photobacterium damselae]NVH52236.1 hypothetical protein [Photobacterium damselae subsp. damselae]NVO82542.1 hypothetical protein [Photobacterium damselae subsp. damselae]
MEKAHVKHLNEINRYWNDVFSSLLILNNKSDVGIDVDIQVNPYIAQLALLSVSVKSVFSDMLWDFEQETVNRPASVSMSKVQLDFNQYVHIPLGVITELKCLFLTVKASPKDFGYRKNEIKPNTLISHFKAGLSFLDFVFSEIEKRLGKDYVQSQCSKLSQVTLFDFEEAASKTKYKLVSDGATNSYRIFFQYLDALRVKEEIGIECDADYQAIKKAYEKSNKEKASNEKQEKLPYLETKNFDLALKKASFYIVSFLQAMGEKVNDPVMIKHYKAIAEKYEGFSLSKQELEDYGAYRLGNKGYSISYIEATFPANTLTVSHDGESVTTANINTRFRKKYPTSNTLRIEINRMYYSALWVIGTLMGARPNVYSDLKIEVCLDLESNTIVAEEHKGRDNRWNLFNDRWVATPIMIDAMKVIEIIGSKLFQNTHVFGNVDTLKPDEISKPMASLRHIVTNMFTALTGLTKTDINSQLNAYTFRHSLAYQMYRADVGLPVISYQLKHVVTATENLVRKGKVSETTLGYGGIANQLVDQNTKGKALNIRYIADLEAVKTNFNPNGKYMGGKADEHLSKIKKYFNGCMESGYSEEEIYDAMVEQGVAIINVGSGYCFGGVEDFDDSLPCIGGLRCNPVRCGNAVVSKANAPKWREIYLENLRLVGAEGFEDVQEQIIDVLNEAKGVLEYLGEDLI